MPLPFTVRFRKSVSGRSFITPSSWSPSSSVLGAPSLVTDHVRFLAPPRPLPRVIFASCPSDMNPQWASDTETSITSPCEFPQDLSGPYWRDPTLPGETEVSTLIRHPQSLPVTKDLVWFHREVSGKTKSVPLVRKVPSRPGASGRSRSVVRLVPPPPLPPRVGTQDQVLVSGSDSPTADTHTLAAPEVVPTSHPTPLEVSPSVLLACVQVHLPLREPLATRTPRPPPVFLVYDTTLCTDLY